MKSSVYHHPLEFLPFGGGGSNGSNCGACIPGIGGPALGGGGLKGSVCSVILAPRTPRSRDVRRDNVLSLGALQATTTHTSSSNVTSRRLCLSFSSTFMVRLALLLRKINRACQKLVYHDVATLVTKL